MTSVVFTNEITVLSSKSSVEAIVVSAVAANGKKTDADLAWKRVINKFIGNKTISTPFLTAALGQSQFLVFWKRNDQIDSGVEVV